MPKARPVKNRNLFEDKRSPKTFIGLIEKWKNRLEQNKERIVNYRESGLTVKPDKLEAENILLHQFIHDLKVLKGVIEKGTN